MAGIDEAGRGALAGPVVAGAVILPEDAGLETKLKGVRDSKQMTAIGRELWAAVIKNIAAGWAVGFASHDEIDEQGIVTATLLAMRRALEQLPYTPHHLLVDYLSIPGYPCPQTALVKGDARSLSIAAASILAKTSRDALMIAMDEQAPDYGFAAHKGYGTQAHLQALAHFGFSPFHRRSFRIKRGIENDGQ